MFYLEVIFNKFFVEYVVLYIKRFFNLSCIKSFLFQKVSIFCVETERSKMTALGIVVI